MERIQEAIAKARATRDATPAPAARVAPTAMEPSLDSTQVGVTAAWGALSPLVIPQKLATKGRIVTISGGKEATAFDAMRTKVIQQMRANNWRRLAITSPAAGCGKTTISLNLAFSLARQPDLRSILVELDLRRPSIAQTLQFKPKAGFSQVLEGRSTFADCAVGFGNNLAIAANTGPVRNAAEMLQSSATPVCLAEIEATYAPDIMIFDMPPMLVTDDAMAFAGQVDCVLLVAAAESTTIKEVDTCEREIASQTNVMGVILNKCRYMGQEYGYGYYG
ncbi:MAG: CpsD/CapB family tyrosine-protein kinase [Rhodobacteraceae bacterium]|nr:CpsD/CapB family tyrosine-protein kinase [Paracoccaceae bacterium]MCF8515789.1 CpsD/CapB family tyrosine-protein kinase [Paracoccaceae bacterium]MCF8520034.1 CpsD/CapB family tyrosine-protein kinase [Paracoccaceae bacterium]